MCGQTGSGKSLTLFSVLSSLDRKTMKVITIEDPVEYEGEDMMQIEVLAGKISFQDALRSSLRLDPDIIMVGEIRDEETAELAFKASSTGHLVFSTLHTNGALEAIVRLKGLGVPDDIIKSNVRLISALTLKKVLCDECKLVVHPGEILDKANFDSLAFQDAEFFRRNTVGCSSPGCIQGAAGRTLLSESVGANEVSAFIDHRIVPGFRSIRQHAVELAACGRIGVEDAQFT
jgi:type II secretory ATPase GspE/PulE/Tfp pilus assembly ATPase PilB-like protein